MYNIKGREVLWDMFLADKNDNIKLEMHKPIRKNIALECDAPWEGEHCGYGSLIYDGEKYRLYYRGLGSDGGPWKNETEVGVGTHCVWCVAYSDDGKTFYKPNLGKYEFEGSKDNNILKDYSVDNFMVFRDENPECRNGEEYKCVLQATKSVEGVNKQYLKCMFSSDGINFIDGYEITDCGAFDSLNVAFWDKEAQIYRCYFRGFHPKGSKNPEMSAPYDWKTDVRDIRYSESKDFKEWSKQRILDL